jgi:nicotinate-nucleotide adenylyltransferase
MDRMEHPRLHPFRHALPKARAGQTIGLLGGSFDPPHAGHVHISREALKRFRLDRVWWLVSPGNPLKPDSPAALNRRMAAARGMMRHPRVTVTDIEARIGTRYTAATLARLFALYPGVRFVWLMGADNLASFHRWEQWRSIMESVAVGVIARPGAGLAARVSPAASRYGFARLRGREAALLAKCDPPAWCFVTVPMVNMSSSDIRARGEWVR